MCVCATLNPRSKVCVPHNDAYGLSEKRGCGCCTPSKVEKMKKRKEKREKNSFSANVATPQGLASIVPEASVLPCSLSRTHCTLGAPAVPSHGGKAGRCVCVCVRWTRSLKIDSTYCTSERIPCERPGPSVQFRGGSTRSARSGRVDR